MPVAIKGKFTHKGTTLKIAQRELNNVTREALKDAAEEYHDKLLPLRFTEYGGRRLGYAPRGKRYQERKKRVKGHNKPFVWSGRSEEEATRVQRIKATATRNKTEVRVAIAARQLNRLDKRFRQEITRLHSREEKQLTNTFAKRFDSHLAKKTGTE